MQLASPTDLAVCHAILARGSKSFALASRLLPARVRGPAASFYAFCRVADDLIDDGGDPQRGLHELSQRLDEIFSGRPRDDAVDRSLAAVVAAFELPRAPFDALLEGFAWDCAGRRCDTFADVIAYGARVAGTVGVVMTMLMGERDPRVLARACDLGVAMQLSNIARDVGEDARNGRLYLPLAWLEHAKIAPSELRTSAGPAVREIVAELLGEADRLYTRADRGIAMLPRDCRVAIRAARLIYSDLHRSIARAGFDTVTQRAFVSKPRKIWLLLRAGTSLVSLSRAPGELEPPPLEEARFLLEAPR